MITSLLQEHGEIIHVDDNALSNWIFKCYVHCALKNGIEIDESEWHPPKCKGSPLHSEFHFVVVFVLHHYLVISRIAI